MLSALRKTRTGAFTCCLGNLSPACRPHVRWPRLTPGRPSASGAPRRQLASTGPAAPHSQSTTASADNPTGPSLGAAGTNEPPRAWQEPLELAPPPAAPEADPDLSAYDLVGGVVPEGVSLLAISEKLPEELFRFTYAQAFGRLLLPLAVVAAGTALNWQLGFSPLLNLLLWLVVGTAYVGLYAVASDCARGAWLPEEEENAQDVVGATLLAPLLFSYENFRISVFNHLLNVNKLGADTDVWHPVSVSDVHAMPAWRVTLTRLVLCTPAKLLGSVVGWARLFDGTDLRSFALLQREVILTSWCLPVAFAALVWPALVLAGGGWQWLNVWLMPWLVFHAWLSLLTLVQHTAPHIPFRPEPAWDHAAAAISGTVTLILPRWLEVLINNANYHMAQHVCPGIPCYKLRDAHAYLRSKLKPYVSECRLSARLLWQLVYEWQLYDQQRQTYVRWPQQDVEEGVYTPQEAPPQGAAA